MDTIKKNARLAGFLYLAMTPFAVLSLYARFSVFVHGDAAATATNILASQELVRVGIVSWLMLQVVQILLVLALYRLLKPVGKNAALLMLVSILAAIPIAFVNELNPFAALLLLNGSIYSAAFDADQLQALAYLFINLHEHGTVIAHVFFAVWLFPMGYLVFKSGFLPRALGVLLIVAGIGYMVDFASFIAFPGRGITVTQYTFIGEVLFPLWLLIKGVKTGDRPRFT